MGMKHTVQLLKDMAQAAQITERIEQLEFEADTIKAALLEATSFGERVRLNSELDEVMDQIDAAYSRLWRGI